MKTEVLTITPELAKEFLKSNTANRPLKKNVVSSYAQDMKRGQWKLTGQGIQISEFGNLIDGQHRLHAIIEADVSIPFLIIYEVREANFDAIDQGVKRTAGDVFSIQDVQNGTVMAASIRGIIPLIKSQNPSIARQYVMGLSRRGASNADIINYYKANKTVCIDAVRLGDKVWKNFKLFRKSLAVTLYMFLVLHKNHNSQSVTEFFYQLAGISNIRCNTIRILRMKMINASASKSFNLSGKHLNSMLVIAWNDYAQSINDRKSLRIDDEKEYRYI